MKLHPAADADALVGSGDIAVERHRNVETSFVIVMSYDCVISKSAFTVFQFRVVATTESFFSMLVLESLVLPYPLGQ